MKKSTFVKPILTVIICGILSHVAFGQTNLSQTPNLLGPNTVTNLLAVPAGVSQLATDGYNVFKQFSLTNPISVGVIGLKNGSLYGGGIEANTVNANSAINAGFAVLGVQTKTTSANGTSKTGFSFFDATVNLSVSQVEMVPVLNVPVTLRVFSGPFASLNGGVLMGEQSGVTADFNFQVGAASWIDLGAGVINDSGAAAKGLNSTLPMVHFNFTHKF
jgi:hypothetical protein